MSKPSFVFRDRISFRWPVTVRIPENGGIVEATFEADFLMLLEDELFEGPADSADPEADPTITAIIENDRKRLRRIWIGMTGVQAEDGTELHFSDETRDAMLLHRHVRQALNAAYNDAMLGQIEERAGN